MIDARKYHDPDSAPSLIEQAIQVVGTQKELAARLGVRRQTIHYIRTGRHTMSYGMQVMLEGVVEGASGAGAHHGE